MIKVLICDDQEIVRKGLNIILTHAEGIEVVGLAEDGLEACKQAAQHDPDVILMDLKMPQLNGVQATEKISKASAESPTMRTPRFSNSGESRAMLPNSVVHTGVKSLGCENSTHQDVPIHS